MLLQRSEVQNGLSFAQAVLATAVLATLLGTSTSVYGQKQIQSPTAGLDVLLQKKQYIKLEQALATRTSQLPPQMFSFFKGVMANRVNQVRKSVQLLEPLVPGLLASNPARAEFVLCTLADDYAKSFRYSDAARTYAEANHVAEENGKRSECDAGGEASRWALLSSAPAQTVDGSAAFTLRGKRDALGLFQVQITAGSYTASWIVDSGANLSVIRRSAAEKMGLELSPSPETAQSAAGVAVPIHTAIIPEVRVGEAVVHNVAVLVIADSDLDFPNIGYHVEGSLGLPVLAALGRVSFYPDGRISFSREEKPSQRDKGLAFHNLFLEKFTLLITADFGHGNQLFTIDTGAMGTVLSAQFYQEGRASLGPANIKLRVMGAGGTLVSPAYVVRSVVVKLGGECARVSNIQVLTDPTGLSDEFYGNIGQNAFSSFSVITVDFKTMHFSVSGGKLGACHAGQQH